MISRRSFLNTATLAGCLPFFASCSREKSGPIIAGARKLLFIDQSDSITDDRRHGWLAMAKCVGGSIEPGDAIQIYAIHDRTNEAGPLFAGELPQLPARPTREHLEGYKRAQKRALEEGRHAIEAAVQTSRPSHGTDVFSVFDRCGPDSQGRPVLAWIFTDALHVGPGLNMEREPLHEDRIAAIISGFAKKHEWHDRSLAGARLSFMLPGAAAGERPRVNDRRALARFYSQLIAALGGKLMRFETYLEGAAS
jgi:hypothetical protein